MAESTSPEAVRAKQRPKNTTPTGTTTSTTTRQAPTFSGLPAWARPAWWDAQVPPPSVVSTTPAEEVISAPFGNGFITITPETYARTQAAKGQSSIEDAWEALVSVAGIEPLGVPTNWWPGIAIQDPSKAWQTQPGGMDWINQDKKWAADPLEFVADDPTTPENENVVRFVRYDVTKGAQQYMAMGANERAKYTELMVEAGMLPEEWAGISEFSPEAAAVFTEALSWANYWGTSVDNVLARRGSLYQKLKDRRGGGGGGGGGPTVKIEVPNYETLTQQAKDLLRKNLGRNPKDWEMTLVADEMQRQYGRWADATRARMVGGNGTYEIPDPQTLSQAFVERTYADEISRLEDIADTTQMNQLLISAATRGTNMSSGQVPGGF